MTGWLILFSNIAAGSVRTIIVFFLIDRLLAINKSDKNSVKWKFHHSDLSVLQGGRMGVNVVIAVGIVVISVILFLTGLSDLYRMVSEIVWLAVCTSYFQNADTRACSNNHSRHLYNDTNASHSPSGVVVAPNSGYIRRVFYAFATYASFIWQIICKMIDTPTNCDAHPAKSIFQAHFRMGLFVSIFYEKYRCYRFYRSGHFIPANNTSHCRRYFGYVDDIGSCFDDVRFGIQHEPTI